ncbi:hypothetical protein DFH07DRAFT_911811 [Mycena maculata]|uniref:Uncharacterized protein n=1 Tax=Mycena maculata TaxID=230809 RepID=A0AAD7K2D8_9AGAR|nr:hypothetical protein DFH07DRAFT_911811 [Mycena maculata]
MPHKRAKRSIREQQRSQKGADLAPSHKGDALSSEPLPKSFTRALNAERVRADFRAKRKLRGEDGEDGNGDGPKKAKRRKMEAGDAQIRPGETLAHFNKRIETDMRPLVRSAVQASLATTRAERKKTVSSSTSSTAPAAASASASTSTNSQQKSKSKQNPKSQAQPDSELEAPDKHAGRPKEFARTSSAAPRRLNDIALAPPDLSAMKRLASKSKSSGKNGSGKASVLSPAQALQMAAAREAAVARYREMKAARRAAGGGDWDTGERGGGAVGEGEGEGEED